MKQLKIRQTKYIFFKYVINKTNSMFILLIASFCGKIILKSMQDSACLKKLNKNNKQILICINELTRKN